MKLKQLLISTASIAALAVVPMSIVSCGNNNNNSVDQLPPANGGDNSTPGTGDNNTGGGDNSTPGTGDGSTPGDGNNNNQEPTIDYVEVDSKQKMVELILLDNNVASEFIRQATANKSFNETLTSIKWSDRLQSMVPSGMSVIEKDGYFYYDVKTITFNYVQGGPVLTYEYNDKNNNNKPVKHYVSGNGSANILVDCHFKSKQRFTNN